MSQIQGIPLPVGSSQHVTDEKVEDPLAVIESLKRKLAEMEEKVRHSQTKVTEDQSSRLSQPLPDGSRTHVQSTLDVLANAVNDSTTHNNSLTSPYALSKSASQPQGLNNLFSPPTSRASGGSIFTVNSGAGGAHNFFPLSGTMPAISQSSSYAPFSGMQVPPIGEGFGASSGKASIFTSHAPFTSANSTGLSAVAAAAETVESRSSAKQSRSKSRKDHQGSPNGSDTANSSRKIAREPNSAHVAAASAAPIVVAAKAQAVETRADSSNPTMVVPVKPEAISVVKRKGTVLVLRWGSPPLAIERTIRGLAFIPNGFLVETISDRLIWIGETKVTDNGVLQYRFSLKTDLSKNGGWHKNASRAYRDAYAQSGNIPKDQLDNLKSSNGRLIIGVTYGNLQERIRKIFNKEVLDLETRFQQEGDNLMMASDTLVRQVMQFSNAGDAVEPDAKRVHTVGGSAVLPKETMDHVSSSLNDTMAVDTRGRKEDASSLPPFHSLSAPTVPVKRIKN